LTDEYYAKVNFNEEIYCNSVTNSNDFNIFTTEVYYGRKKIIGFKFKFKSDKKFDFDKKIFDYTLLNKYVLHYFDFISSLTLYPLSKNYYEIKIFDKNDKYLGKLRIQTPLPMRREVDIDLNMYHNTLSDLSDKSIENFRYYYAGVFFYYSRLYEFSIREFFKIIEMENSNSIPRYNDYKHIRHLFSHNYEKMKDSSKYFRNSGLKKEFSNFHDDGKIVIIDRYDPSNLHSLLLMAKELKEIVEPIVLN
jgi:hypothetical protein